ncbi:thermonuclease family protein [Marivivens sp. LCG002]|uniref:thermonuclease family protein n=1 Tax=Marivivens sp. LCG002 TaxID=3051171 RepID=UPI0025544B1B|nr:thermonuclease family protein [Marivivens sp. LCG002]WIV52054.1 thermonuclease family protein [Marivivens sp. LCG002]
MKFWKIATQGRRNLKKSNAGQPMLRIVCFSLAGALFASPVAAIEKCGNGQRITCVVDGDTFWLDGTKYRIAGYDTPEPQTGICGGQFERDLAARASNRFIDLWNTTEITIHPKGIKGARGRDLVDVFSNGINIGNILVSEGLAREWPDGCEFWCNDCGN